MASWKEIFWGSEPKIKKKDIRSPEMKELANLIMQGLTSGEGPFAEMFGEFNEEEFNKGVADPAIKKFQEEILPQIQESYLGRGSLGSGLQRATMKAGSDFQSKLAELLYNARQQHKQNRAGGIQNILSQNPYQNFAFGGTTGAIPGFVKGFANKAGESLGSNIFGGGGGGGGGGMQGMEANAAKVMAAMG